MNTSRLYIRFLSRLPTRYGQDSAANSRVTPPADPQAAPAARQAVYAPISSPRLIAPATQSSGTPNAPPPKKTTPRFSPEIATPALIRPARNNHRDLSAAPT